ncbi:vacuolar protein sorting-associated protein 36 [Phlegmacium glaucopus]|nr:vacuolar protein sorting-associated protein 36 [Phlegmacium glaucopus]
MARGFPRPVDGSIPVQALLYNDEELLASQDGVGIYYGSQKSPEHQNGTIHVTTHRLFYIDAQRMVSNSFQMDLSLITQTEYYAGLFKSSPKVTCHLTGNPGGSDPNEQEAGFESWECQVCAYRNPPGLSPAAARICGLCGVPRTAVPITTTSVLPQHLSSSLPSSALSSSTSLTVTSSYSVEQSSIACPACTFLNHSSLLSCEICSTDLSRLKRESIKSAPSSRSMTPGFDDIDESSKKMVKISFRKGGDKPFYTVLKRSLKSKVWEESGALTRDVNRIDLDDPHPIGMTGISGILRTVETSAQGRETHMKDALQDLEALMVKAKDMVRLAAELNEKLTAASTSRSSAAFASNPPEPEEATFIRSSLSQLGLEMSNTPVTLDMMKDERRWFEELARELAGILQGTTKRGIMKERGIIALDEVWGSWNRARGVALIPPSTFLQVIPHLPTYTEPVIQHRAFPSGLNVLHTPPYTQAAFAARISSFLVLGGPKTTVEIAAEENLTVGLVSEMMDAVEMDGTVCRDDSIAAITGGGSGAVSDIRWWGNLFVDYIWDGPE